MHTLTKEWELPDAPSASDNTLSPAEREKLVTDNLGLARRLAGDAARLDPNADAEDLFGECCLAFMESARKWNPDDPNGTPFGGYAAAYARRRLFGRVVDAAPKGGQAIVRGLDLAIIPSRSGESAGESNTTADEYDRELLACLKPDARDVVRAVIFDRISPAAAAARFGRPEKDISLILRNSVALLQRRKQQLDADDLFDTDTGAA